MAEITIRISDRALRMTGILLGGIAVAWVFFYLWSPGVFIPKYRLRVYVPEAEGLTAHAKVKLDGVEVGSVSAIRLAGESASPERRIELVLRIEKRYQDAIRSDSVATLITEGLLGDREVSINRGFKGSVINPDGEIPFAPTGEVTLKDFVTSIGKTMDCSQVQETQQKTRPKSPQKRPPSPGVDKARSTSTPPVHR